MLNIEELSISGGGVKGYAYIGALYRLEEIGALKNLKKVIGVSIGSLFAVCLVLKLKVKELIDFFFEYDIKKIKDIDLVNFFNRKSLLKGEKYKEFVTNIIEKKVNKDISLNELYDMTGIELVIVVCCINKKNVEYISYKTDPDLSLINLIMMSSAIPGFFPPVQYKNNLYVDGGILDNNPIGKLGTNSYGICQKSRELVEEYNTYSFIDYFGSVLHMIYKNIQNNVNKDDPNLIKVECGNIKVTSFNISKDEKLSLIRYGINSVNEFISQKALHPE